MKTSIRTIFALSAFLIVLILIAGCSDKSETQVNYIGPAGYVVKEVARPAQTITEAPDTDNSAETPAPAVPDTPAAPAADPAKPATTPALPSTPSTPTSQDQDPQDSLDDNNQIQNYLSADTLQAKKADLKEVMPRICDDSQILAVGYVSCTYDSKTGYAILTLKNNNKMPIQEVWFYITNSAQKISYEKSGGILAGETSDYALPISRWTTDYGKLDRVVVTPAIKMPAGIYACNNKQLLAYWTKSSSGCQII